MTQQSCRDPYCRSHRPGGPCDCPPPRALQVEVRLLREALEEIYRLPCAHPDDPDEISKLLTSYVYAQNVAYHALNGMAPPKDWELSSEDVAKTGEPSS